jgi:uncharacterized membrane protein YqjE
METRTPASHGFLDSLRDLGDGLMGSLQNRLELLSVELHEEKFRLIQIFIWISAAIFSGMLAITFASITLVYLFWDSARIFVLGGLTAIYTIMAIVIILSFRSFVRRQPKPFAATLNELQQDRATLRAQD